MSLPFSVGMRSRLRADIQSAEVGKYREMSWRISFGRFVGNKESGAEDFQSYPLTSPYFFSTSVVKLVPSQLLPNSVGGSV